MKTKLWLLALLVLCAPTMYAQDPTATPDQAPIDSVSILKEQLNKDKNVQKIKEQKEEIARLKKQVDSLNNRIKQLGKDTIQMIKNHQQEITQLQEQLKQNADLIAQMKKDAESLEAFKGPWLAQLAQSVDTEWLTKTFQEIDPTLMEYTYSQYEAYASADPKVAEARDKMKSLVEAYAIYAQGKQAVELCYDAAVVKPLVAKVNEIRNATTHSGRKAELDALYQQLNDYGVTVGIFQDVIKAVDEIITKQNQGGQLDDFQKKAVASLIQKELDRQETEYEYISAIKVIPWLATQYETYYQALMADFMAPNPTHDVIMQLKP